MDKKIRMPNMYVLVLTIQKTCKTIISIQETLNGCPLANEIAYIISYEVNGLVLLHKQANSSI